MQFMLISYTNSPTCFILLPPQPIHKNITLTLKTKKKGPFKDPFVCLLNIKSPTS